MAHEDDAKLLRAWAARGDREALNALARAHYGAALDLARRLDRDRHLAEDAVQDAFLNLMRAARDWRGDGTVRAWLYRTVVNAVRTRQRKRGRREGHESARAAQPARGTETPDAAAFRAEVRAQVDALPTDQQVPVVLHYFRGLSHTEIGAVIDAPAGTVTSRIRAAKQHLKTVLAGAAAAAALPLEEALAQLDTAPTPPPAPFARLLQALDGARSGAPVAGGAAAVAARWLTARLAAGVLTGLVIGGAALGTWWLTHDATPAGASIPLAVDAGGEAGAANGAPADATAPGGGGERTGATPAAAATPRGAAAAVAAEAAPAATELVGEELIDRPGRGAIGFRVVDPAGDPIAGARARVAWEPGFPLNDANGREPDPRTPMAVTDADGRAQLFVEFPFLKNRYVTYIWIRATGYTPRRIDRLKVDAGRVTLVGDVTLQPGRVVEGRVLDATGAPVANAAVWSSNRAYATGDPVEDSYSALQFWVFGRERQPDDAVRTGPDGAFRLPGAGDPATTLFVQAEGFQDHAQAIATPGPQRITVRLEPGLSVRGRVVAQEGGAPVAGVKVHCAVAGSARKTGRVAVTGEDGTFAVDGLPAGAGTALVQDREWGMRTQARFTVEPGLAPVELTAFRLPARERNRGPASGVVGDWEFDAVAEGAVVYADSGQPVPDYEVVLWQRSHAGTELEANNILHDRVRRPDGRFTVNLTADPKARTLLLIRARGTAARRIPLDLAAGDHRRDLRIELRRAGAGLHLQGIVLDRTSRAPLAGVEVKPLMRMDPRVPNAWEGAFAPDPHPLLSPVVTGPDGRFTIRWAGEAQMHLVVRGEAVGAGRAVIRNARVAEAPLEVTLRSTAGIAGTVRTPAGTPADALRVTLHRVGSDRSLETQTDHAGAYRFGSLGTGRYVVSVWTPAPRPQPGRAPDAWLPDLVQCVELQETGVHALDLQLPSAIGRVSGRLVRPAGYDGMVYVHLMTDAGVGDLYRLRAGHDAFEFPHVAAGRYFLRIRPDGSGNWSGWTHGPFALGEGESLALPVLRVPDRGTLTLTATHAGGEPVSTEWRVSCSRSRPHPILGSEYIAAGASPDAHGRLRLRGLPPGRYDVFTWDPKSQARFGAELEVVAGTTEYRVTLERLKGE